MVTYRHNAYKFCTAITDYVIIECIINNMVRLDAEPMLPPITTQNK